VPSRGQSDYVQGELLRAVAKLQDEAQRNGNINWDEGHEIFALYLSDTIKESNILDEKQLKKFKKDIKCILKYKEPYTEDDLYTRLEYTVVDFFMQNSDPIKREHNLDLHR
jgi:hypothetical protein